MTGRDTALGGLGLAAGAGVAGVVAVLLHRTLQPVEEIRRYASDVLTAAGGILDNVTVSPELGTTRELAQALPALVAGHLGSSAGGQS